MQDSILEILNEKGQLLAVFHSRFTVGKIPAELNSGSIRDHRYHLNIADCFQWEQSDTTEQHEHTSYCEGDI